MRCPGIGNLFCGFLGALPMMGVIVRSKANLQSGARMRVSTAFHGVWVLLIVGLFPVILELVPIQVWPLSSYTPAIPSSMSRLFGHFQNLAGEKSSCMR